MDERTEIINTFLNNNKELGICYNTKILYWYDENFDAIRSDTGFCVLVDKCNNELTYTYLYNLIIQLNTKIKQYNKDILKENPKLIRKIWEEIHKNNSPKFYWEDKTETEYFYDEKTDTIKSDNGFCVLIEKHGEDITKEYIYELIEKLKYIIVLYYRYKLKHELNYELYRK